MFKKIMAGFLCVATMCACAGCADETTTSKNDLNKPDVNIEGNIGDVTLKDGDKYAVIKIKDYGDITIKLFPDAAPKGVANFEKLANEGFYTGKNFHRIIEGFMAQGGAANDEQTVEQFGIETNYNMRHFYGAFCYANAMGNNSTQFYIVNNKEPQDLSNYSISKLENNITAYENMASNYEKGTQEHTYYSYQADFYRQTKDFFEKNTDEIAAKYKEKGGTPSLDGNYTVFGQTVDGFDVLDKISAVDVTANSDMNNEISKPKTEVIIESVTVGTYKA